MLIEWITPDHYCTRLFAGHISNAHARSSCRSSFERLFIFPLLVVTTDSVIVYD